MRFRWILLFVLAFGITSQAATGRATASWDRNPESEVSSYTLFWGPTSSNYLFSVNTTNITVTVSNLAFGTNFFAVKANIDAQGLQSDFSDEVMFVVRPGKPTKLKLSLQQAKDPAGPWYEIGNVFASLDALAPATFYRSQLLFE